MKKVITYGTYDKLHYGHIRLLERAKALGDYLIVAVTSEDFDKARGKINVQQSLTERIAAVRDTGIADEIIIEEYEGQKIDDIRRYDVDIFTVGSDWVGHFDYLQEYCKVVYLDRTEGVSSSQIRSEEQKIRLGIIGDDIYGIDKFVRESDYVNGLEIVGLCTIKKDALTDRLMKLDMITDDSEVLLNAVDAIYILTHPEDRDEYVERAIELGKHIIFETPITIDRQKMSRWIKTAEDNGLVLMDGIKTAYALAFERLILLLKSGVIGDVISIDATCTSLKRIAEEDDYGVKQWGSLCSWGPFAMLPIFSILGCDYKAKEIQSKKLKNSSKYDLFTKINFIYDKAVATIKVGNGVKSEGELVISGTNGYVYVPAPWWKTEYFEVRFEDSQNNKRYFYQLEGEGIRYMLVNYIKSIQGKRKDTMISMSISSEITKVIEDYMNDIDVINI